MGELRQEGQLAHLALWVIPLTTLYFTHQKRAPRKGQPEALAAAAGLLFPGCLLHLASIFIGVEDLGERLRFRSRCYDTSSLT